jgi:hypothetical protein
MVRPPTLTTGECQSRAVTPSDYVAAVLKMDWTHRSALGNMVAGGRAIKHSRAPRREVWREDRRMTAGEMGEVGVGFENSNNFAMLSLYESKRIWPKP